MRKYVRENGNDILQFEGAQIKKVKNKWINDIRISGATILQDIMKDAE